MVTAFRFPHGDAMSNRALNLIRAAGGSASTPLIINFWPNDGSQPEHLQTPAGIDLLTIHHGALSRVGRLAARAARPVIVARVIRRAGLRRSDVGAVIVPQGLLTLAMVMAVKTVIGCNLVVDLTERHDRRQFKRGILDAYFVRHRWTAFLAAVFATRITGVSSLLVSSFERRGRQVRVVPPQVDCAEFAPDARPSIEDEIRLVYAGTPGSKDMLNVLVEGMKKLSGHEQQRIHLAIAGITKAQALTMSDLTHESLGSPGPRIQFLGRIPRKSVLDLLASSHFSVLIRPPGGYADAGFPSKVPESLAAGCPIFLNYTSDLPRYITDGCEGTVIDDCTSDAVYHGFKSLLSLNDRDWQDMSSKARLRAERSFDFRSFGELEDFVRA